MSSTADVSALAAGLEARVVGAPGPIWSSWAMGALVGLRPTPDRKARTVPSTNGDPVSIPLTRDARPPEDLPAVLSVEEAAAYLRIGRTCAYELARRYVATGGAEGLPVVRLGRLLRVPRAGLVRLLEPAEPP